ncbi:outer-membrane lipoprotein carrier protein LolA [uncultured Pseudoteredinibacter sp.]|uniref:LolA family protein n=1 Tax=uncultured Pseudoteredinibacter sp. TaxID=1641701 RepID=UPI002623CE83|nr:outer-membrane lipoprotein carrier protein LolA [uncultured Pseudoteredinibacter sp.]
MTSPQTILVLLGLILSSISNYALGLDPKIQQQLSQIEFANKGNFKQENKLQGIPFPIKSSGHYEFSSGTLTWQNRKPIKSSLVLTADTIEQYVAGEKRLSVSADEQPILRTINQLFLTLFDRDWSKLSESFKLKLTNTEEQWQLKLTPKQETIGVAIESASVYGDIKIRRFEFTKSNKDQTMIWFTDEDK